MPKRIYRRKTPLTTDERSQRARRKRVVRAGAWIDPFPNVNGTLPEKMVYAKLIERGIQFNFQAYQTFHIPDFKFKKDYRPDFIIPSKKIIIEVQGAYWHSKEKAIVDDAFKFSIYEALGYKVLVWWDYEILSNLDLLFTQEPSLRHTNQPGRQLIVKGRQTTIDDTKGIVTLNRKRTDYGKREAHRRTKKSRSIYSYAVK